MNSLENLKLVRLASLKNVTFYNIVNRYIKMWIS